MRIICTVYFDETGFSLSLTCAQSLCLRAPGRRETGLLWRDVLAQYGAQKGASFAFLFFEITQQSASALSHGLLSLTKHKKCMYNQHRRLYLQTIRLALHVEGTTEKGEERKRKAESPPWLQVLAPQCANQPRCVPKWRKMSLIYLAYRRSDVDMNDSITNMRVGPPSRTGNG